MIPDLALKGVAAPGRISNAGMLLDDSDRAGQVGSAGNDSMNSEGGWTWRRKRGRSSTNTETRV